MTKIVTKNVLVLMALPQESQGLFEAAKVPMVFTGIGKVNATFHAQAALLKHRPQLVLNLGTAGSFVHSTGALVECVEFVQRDMDLSPAGVPKYQTFSDVILGNIEVERRFEKLPAAVCGTGDNFDVSGKSDDYSLVDMEAYALAKVCRFMDVPFASVKYISDGADNTAHSDWRKSLKPGAKALLEFYQSHFV